MLAGVKQEYVAGEIFMVGCPFNRYFKHLHQKDN